MSPEYHRQSDGYLESKVKVIGTLVKTLGLSTVLCIYFLWRDYTRGPQEMNQKIEMTLAIDNLTRTVSTLNDNILIQTKILRHKHGDE